MNNIQAKDWAEDDWGCYSGMSSNPYDDVVEEAGEAGEVGKVDDVVGGDEDVQG